MQDLARSPRQALSGARTLQLPAAPGTGQDLMKSVLVGPSCNPDSGRQTPAGRAGRLRHKHIAPYMPMHQYRGQGERGRRGAHGFRNDRDVKPLTVVWKKPARRLSQTLHGWHIYLHWGGFRGQCRHIYIHGVFGYERCLEAAVLHEDCEVTSRSS